MEPDDCTDDGAGIQDDRRFCVSDGPGDAFGGFYCKLL